MATKTKPEAQDAGKDAAAKPKHGKRALLLVLLPVLLVGAFGYKTMTKKPPVALDKGGPTTTVAGPTLEETSLTVNLRDGHYLEFTAALQVAAGHKYTALANDQPIVLDILNSQAEATTEVQLLLPGGVAALKASIIRALDQDWPGLVVNVFFEQFVMQ
jgi:flagellar basal body-associated protein FliL